MRTFDPKSLHGLADLDVASHVVERGTPTPYAPTSGAPLKVGDAVRVCRAARHLHYGTVGTVGCTRGLVLGHVLVRANDGHSVGWVNTDDLEPVPAGVA